MRLGLSVPRIDEFRDLYLGVFSSRLVMELGEPILLVIHEENGEWQFLSSHEEHVDEIVLIHLAHVLDIDPSLNAVEDLPGRWDAWRSTVDDDWVRELIPQNPPSLDEYSGL